MISYREAQQLDESVLRRWLLWAIKGDPAEERIKAACLGSKTEILVGLTWIGVIG